MLDSTINCKACAIPANGKYCSNCGQPINLKRVDAHYVTHEIQHILHFEKGILYTVKELLINPGRNVKEFITDNRSRLVKPIIFIIITSLVYSTLNHFFHVEDGYISFQGEKTSATTAMFNWMQHHYGYSNIIIGVFIAAWLKLFFRKCNYNFFEILILLCFVMGMGMLIFAVFTIAEGLSKISLMQIASIIGIGYCTWAIGQFFDGKKASAYFKAFFAYMLGMLTSALAALLVGFLIDLLIKH